MSFANWIHGEDGHYWRLEPGGWWQRKEVGVDEWETLEPPADVLDIHARLEAKQREVDVDAIMRKHGMEPPARAPEVEPDLAVIRPAHVKPERVAWLWPGRIPFGKLTVADGDPGLGKSCITLDLGARVTTGSPLPDGHHVGPMGVLLLSAEDGVADTIVPRLTVAGADLELVTIIDHVTDEQGPRPVELPADLDRLERYLAGLLYGEQCLPPGLLVVDPLMAFLGGEVNANRDQDVRRVLFRLKLLAERTGVAVVVVRHLNKAPGANPLYRGGGSIGIIGAARAGLLVGVDPDDTDRRILAVSKSNLAAKPPSLAYRLVNDDLYDVAKVAWDGTSDHSAEDLLGHPIGRASPQQDQAETFLTEALAKDSQPVSWLQQHAKRKGVSWSTVKRAKEALEVIVERRGEPGKRGGGAWWWRLPAGQLSMTTIKETASSISPDGPLNHVNETAGQSPDSEPPEIKETTDHDGALLDGPVNPPPAWRCGRCGFQTTHRNVAAYQHTVCGGLFHPEEPHDG